MQTKNHLITTGVVSIEESVLSIFCYYDVFKHPLTAKEIRAHLPINSVSDQEVSGFLSSSSISPFIRESRDYYFLYDCDESIIESRIEKEKFARKRRKAARFITRIVRIFPYVRSVMISGELSKNQSGRKSDIDYFILTEPGRLWITRACLTMFKKILFLNNRTFLCLNYFRSTDYLSFSDQQDFFIAIELLTLKPTFNSEYYYKLKDSNTWVRSMFPNFEISNSVESMLLTNRRSILQKAFEKILSYFDIDYLDTKIMKWYERYWRKQYAELSPEELAYNFRCSPRESTAFGEDSRKEIMRRYTEKYNILLEELRKNGHA